MRGLYLLILKEISEEEEEIIQRLLSHFKFIHTVIAEMSGLKSSWSSQLTVLYKRLCNLCMLGTFVCFYEVCPFFLKNIFQ